MTEEKVDQVKEEVKTDQSSEEQSEETKEEPITTEKVYELAKGLQKGYTLNRQEIAEIKENLNSVLEAVNSQKKETGDETEYLTVGKLREILAEQGKAEETRKTQADTYIDGTLEQLKADGIIKTKEEEDELIKYAIDRKEPDLLKAAERWQEVKQAREEGKKEIAKTKTRQEEGSKVGTSSKVSGESKGVDYATIHNTDWSRF